MSEDFKWYEDHQEIENPEGNFIKGALIGLFLMAVFACLLYFIIKHS